MTQSHVHQNWPPPEPEEAEAVAAIKDPVLRNLLITQSYHELTVGLTQLFEDKNVSWCAYAVWASKSAGIHIRKEQVPAMIDSFLKKESEDISQLVWRLNAVLKRFDRKVDMWFMRTTLEIITDEVSKHIAKGNLIVFEEVAPLFARMLKMFLKSSSYDQVQLDRFLGYFKPGTVEKGGQDMLIKAFTNYYRAIFEKDHKSRAELLLLANLLVGYHEQIRLQGPIVGAMNAPVDSVFEKTLLDNIYPLIQFTIPWFLRRLARSSIKIIIRNPARKIAAEWRQLTTKWLVTLELPDETLEIDKDIPSQKTGKMFPTELLTLQNPELRTLAKQLDRTPNTTTGSAARDWGNLNDRMNFIGDFFRSRQQDTSLYQLPFTYDQATLIRARKIPEGKL